MGPPRGRRRIRKQRHDLTGYHGPGSIERPYPAKFAQVCDPGSFSLLAPAEC
jgi:hypothetical protein